MGEPKVFDNPDDLLADFDNLWSRFADLCENAAAKNRYNALWKVERLPEYQSAWEAMADLRRAIKEKVQQ